MRILFWGTPEFAVPPLRALLGEGYDVVGVVTQPDRPRGRSRSQLDPSPVKVVALEEGVPVLQPEKPRGEAFLAELATLAPDISVVVAYGHILPKVVIDAPPRGTLNIHASRRFAAPRRFRRPFSRGMPRRGSPSCAWCPRSTPVPCCTCCARRCTRT
jgi:methionyl-tRNA formyltransferase